ncbi:MAG: hypothetical protein FJW27_06480 [Acidimicrobiia bacterium]|nr:hypothetical protein [Acidimicrobiia bacterium]
MGLGGLGARGRHALVGRALVVAWVVLTFGRVVIPPAGLHAQYFGANNWSGPVLRDQIDRDVSTAQLRRGWDYTPPDVFSVRWRGYVYVSQPATYVFSLNSDDGSALYLDRRLIVDNGAGSRRATVALARGSHAVMVEYSQSGGPYALEWQWAIDSVSAMTPVSPWRLSIQARSGATLRLFAAVRLAWPPMTALVVVVLVAWALRTGRWPGRDEWGGVARRPIRADRRAGLACLAFCVLLAVVHTWPLASAPGQLSRNDNADTVLNEWTMAWVAHQLPRDPMRMFDANIFYPERRTLALSEPLIVQGVTAAPFLAAGASPVLAYNIVLLAGMALTAWSMCLVMWSWTDDWLAGLVAGIVLAFNAHTLTRLPHMQAQHAEFLPIALYAFDAVLRGSRWSATFVLAATVALQAFASVYLFVFVIVALSVALAVRPEDWWGPRMWQIVKRLLVASAASAVVLIPLFLPYLALRASGFVRSLDEAGWFAASTRDYLTTPARWYAWAGGATALFPGVAPVLLGSVAVVTARAIRDARARMCLATACVGVLLSFGPAWVPGYETLHGMLPLFQAVRTTSRFGYLGIVGLAGLAGFGLMMVRRQAMARPVLHAGLGVVAVAAVSLEPLAAPLELQPFHGVSPLYRTLEAEPGAVVIELPFPRPESVYLNAAYMLNSTAHWRPLVNGYSGFTPPSYVERYLELRDFPSDTSIEALRRLGVTHMVVHFERLSADQRDHLARRSDLRRLAEDEQRTIYLLNPNP